MNLLAWNSFTTSSQALKSSTLCPGVGVVSREVETTDGIAIVSGKRRVTRCRRYIFDGYC